MSNRRAKLQTRARCYSNARHNNTHARAKTHHTQARQLLTEASEGLNPFEGFTPKLADGESLAFGTEEFDNMEAAGLEAAAKTAFVLVSAELHREVLVLLL